MEVSSEMFETEGGASPSGHVIHLFKGIGRVYEKHFIIKLSNLFPVR